MAKGMWTKHFTPSGKAYYFNASQNMSLWEPPRDSIIHEAPNLRNPASSDSAVDKPISNTPIASSSLQLSLQKTSELVSNPIPAVATIDYTHFSGTSVNPHYSQQTTQIPLIDERSIQEKMDRAVNRTQKDTSGRFKRATNNEQSSGDGGGSIQSAYLAQKNEYTKMAGSRGDDGADGGKWFVR